MTVDQSTSPGSAADARGRRTDLAPLRTEWNAVHGELSSVVEAILAQIFATASRQAVEVLARLEREGTDLLGDLESRRSAAQAEMTELAGRLEHLERRVSLAEEERRQALDAAERATSELLVRARHQADEIINDAETRAEARLADSDHEAARRIAEAEARAARIVEEAQRRADEVEREIERQSEHSEPEPAVVEAAVVEDQLRGLADRISRLLQTTSEVTTTQATVESARQEEVEAASEPAIVPLRGTSDEAWPDDDAAPTSTPTPAQPASSLPSAHEAPSMQPYTFEPRSVEASPWSAGDADEGGDEEQPERDVVVPLRPRTVEEPAALHPNAPGAAEPDPSMSGPSVADDVHDEAPPGLDRPDRDAAEPDILDEGEPDPWLTPATAVDDELDRRPGGLPLADADDERDAPAAYEPERDTLPRRPNGAAEPVRPFDAVTAEPAVADSRAASRTVPADDDMEIGQSPVQTLVFQSVPNFQAALGLERALKGLPGVSDVRVADFDERQLTFQVTHDLGAGLTRTVLALRSHDLDLVDSGRDRAEFVFRA